MYADTITESMRKAISETNRRRKIQSDYNKKHDITPKTIYKAVREVIEATKTGEEIEKYNVKQQKGKINKEEIKTIIEALEQEMKEHAKNLEFEKAAELRDRIKELQSRI
jgi:excinuclease ABC subunit B